MDGKNRCNKLKMITAVIAIIICSYIGMNTIKSYAGPLLSKPTTAANSHNAGSCCGRFYRTLRNGISSSLSSAANSLRSGLNRVSEFFRSNRRSGVENNKSDIKKLKKEITILKQKVKSFKKDINFLKDYSKELEASIKSKVNSDIPESVLSTMYKDLIQAKVKIAEGTHDYKKLKEFRKKLRSITNSK